MSLQIFGIIFQAWHLYLVIGLLTCVAEIFVPGLILLPIGLSLLFTSLFSLWVTDTSTELLFLASVTLFVFYLSRKYIHAGRPEKTLASNVESMIGQEALVEEVISSEKNSGYVKLYGDSWRAVCNELPEVPVGTKVIIEQVLGNKVVVRNKNQSIEKGKK